MGGQGLHEVISNFEAKQQNGLEQSSLGTSTKAPLIKCGQLKFAQMTARDIVLKFNALYGSNIRPKAELIKE